MRRKTQNAPQKDAELTERYKEIGISAVAAAARYQRKGKSKKPSAELSKEKDTGDFLHSGEHRRDDAKSELPRKSTQEHSHPSDMDLGQTCRRPACRPELRFGSHVIGLSVSLCLTA